MIYPLDLYLRTVLLAFVIAAVMTPLVRWIAVRLGRYDVAHAGIKTHKVPTPALGGVAIWIALSSALVWARFTTSFPTGTLRSLRGILAGGGLLFALGLVDDLRKPVGLGVPLKFAVQIAAAGLCAAYGLRIQFLKPEHLGLLVTILWVVGVTNAFNIIDIMDGLAASQAAIAGLAFLWIALPSEEIYVNFGAAALLGACLGFLPWNLSSGYKIFMGDSGSLSVGFVLSALAMGTRYSEVNPLGVYAPLLILAVPIYDTLFVMYLRMKRGMSPFMGSRDHFALRLEALGLDRGRIVFLTAAGSLLLSVCAWLVTVVSAPWAVWIYIVILGELLLFSRGLARIKMQ